MSLLVLPSPKFVGLLATCFAFAAHGARAQSAADISETATSGARISLGVMADGTPAPTIQWTKDGAPITGATAANFVLASVTTNDTGVYNAIATNSQGWALSNDFVLTVASANFAPSFTVQPFPSASAETGISLTLSAVVVSSPASKFQWRKNNVAIAGATTSTLVFSSLTPNDSGTYSIVATNAVGSTTSNDSRLTVTAPAAVAGAPVFLIQPVDLVVARRDTAMFKVSVSGTPAPQYQWARNGAAIAGATNAFYSISNVTNGHAGTYAVTAKNTAGSVTSKTAVLSISK